MRHNALKSRALNKLGKNLWQTKYKIGIKG